MHNSETCDTCTTCHRLDAIAEKLPEEREFLGKLWARIECAETDATYYEMKYHGTWPTDRNKPMNNDAILADLERTVRKLLDAPQSEMDALIDEASKANIRPPNPQTVRSVMLEMLQAARNASFEDGEEQE